jgi:hypothetical protein
MPNIYYNFIVIWWVVINKKRQRLWITEKERVCDNRKPSRVKLKSSAIGSIRKMAIDGPLV